MNGVLFIKTVPEAWVRSSCSEVEKEGREDVLRILSFILSTIDFMLLFLLSNWSYQGDWWMQARVAVQW